MSGLTLNRCHTEKTFVSFHFPTLPSLKILSQVYLFKFWCQATAIRYYLVIESLGHSVVGILSPLVHRNFQKERFKEVGCVLHQERVEIGFLHDLKISSMTVKISGAGRRPLDCRAGRIVFHSHCRELPRKMK